MNQYWALLKSNFASALIKRGDFFGHFFSTLVQMLAIIVLWVAIYQPQQAINGYSLQDTIMYYVLVLLITYATTTTTVDYISKSIKSGAFSEWLLKPRHVLIAELSRAFGEQLFRMLVLLPIYLLIIIFINATQTGIKFGFEAIFLGIFFTLCGFFINCLLEFALALFAFWLDEVWSLKHFKEVSSELLGGRRIPLAFFPSWLMSINNFLPFRFIYFIPLEYFLGKRLFSGNFLADLIIVIIWLVLFLALISLIYQRGIKRYGAFGN